MHLKTYKKREEIDQPCIDLVKSSPLGIIKTEDTKVHFAYLHQFYSIKLYTFHNKYKMDDIITAHLMLEFLIEKNNFSKIKIIPN